MTAPEIVTLPRLAAMKKEGRKIAAMTAYDASFARAMDEAGMDVILVGDSLGHVIQGRTSTVPVTLDDMAYHTHCVARVVNRALLMADLPFLSFQGSADRVLDDAGVLMRAGAHMVKGEGAGPFAANAAYLAARGVPVCGHIGLTPQFVHSLGGYRVQGRGHAGARLLSEAKELADAGVSLLVLEAVPAALAAQISAAVAVPTIGIGAGPSCDGQVLVMHDALGMGARRPRFVRDFLAGRDSIAAAFAAYIDAVRQGAFPSADESYGE
ncbi:3-methyl-2-oxobutanoate hydroxymethyltransferase [Acidiferrobacter sp.]|uniref:3-methyl-2-oxobutanoate hydroxymethyltransferase n=1 Tax=Acidiferrobacter sp. TaxID=1872107 RepID=UPI002608B6C2|nr:3-methyl-2-oxobutanoate hydroxymethyltransferase [Acidiferrobacter sp.]